MELVNYETLFSEDKQKTAELIKENLHRGITLEIKRENTSFKSTTSECAVFTHNKKQAIAMFYSKVNCMKAEKREVRVIDIKVTPKQEILLMVADVSEKFLRTFVINTKLVYKTKQIKLIRQK